MADELAFSGDAVADEVDGQWLISVGLRPGAAGEDRFNALTSACFTRSQVCPTGMMAMVVGDRIVTAPTVQAATFSGSVQFAVTDEHVADSIVAILNGADA